MMDVSGDEEESSSGDDEDAESDAAFNATMAKQNPEDRLSLLRLAVSVAILHLLNDVDPPLISAVYDII